MKLPINYQSGHYRAGTSGFMGGVVLVGLAIAYLVWPEDKVERHFPAILPNGDSTRMVESWSGTVGWISTQSLSGIRIIGVVPDKQPRHPGVTCYTTDGTMTNETVVEVTSTILTRGSGGTFVYVATRKP